MYKDQPWWKTCRDLVVIALVGIGMLLLAIIHLLSQPFRKGKP